MIVSTASAYDFRSILAMRSRQKLPAGTSSGVAPVSAADGTETGSDAAASTDDTASRFADLIKGTPEQRMFKAFLARHHLDTADYAALSTEDQKKLRDEFEEEMKKKVGSGDGAATSVDVVV